MNKEFDQLVTRDIKEEIYKDHNLAVKQSNSFADYVQTMHDKCYRIEPTINKSDQLQGFKIYDKQSGLTFKASDISPNCGIKDLILNKNLNFQDLGKQLNSVKDIVSKGSNLNPVTLSNPLLKVLDLSFKIASQLVKGFDNGIGMGL